MSWRHGPARIRAGSSSDARRVELTVTAAGRRVLQADFVTPQQRLVGALGRLSSKQLGELRVLLEKVVSLSDMDSKTPPMFFEQQRKKKLL